MAAARQKKSHLTEDESQFAKQLANDLVAGIDAMLTLNHVADPEARLSVSEMRAVLVLLRNQAQNVADSLL